MSDSALSVGRMVQIDDVVMMEIPDGTDTSDPEIRAAMERFVRRAVVQQYADPDLVKPLLVNFRDTEWLITDDPEKIEEFQPAGHCEECQAGNESAVNFLQMNPGRSVAMANLHYVEVWP